MPVAQQNAMVQKYCTVCHTDASMNGGISFEHFDAAHADPGEVAMMVGKLKTQALGASGQPLPDRATQDAFQAALTAESSGAERWVVNQAQGLLTASVVEASTSAYPDIPDLYRLKLTCHLDKHRVEMQLAWSPAVPKKGQRYVCSDGRKHSLDIHDRWSGDLRQWNGGKLRARRHPVGLDSVAGKNPEDQQSLSG